ncbi:uncharacterized protein LOC122638702 [Telopea speciosissima]|uniref:uncharacterized protein LOC122638702 n=1 Tax=Telopea speciosissima TaxID=54955 RepID=UPI001CC6AA9A|nr:uncharacterized protein LOC122638702 [Telopea speciosissima]
MEFTVEYLDLILVPAGLLIMLSYHLYLIYRVLRCPATTVIGYENLNRMAWVERMMQGNPSNTSLALSVISTNISFATFLASVSLTLSSLIGALVGSSSSNLFRNVFVLGDIKSNTVFLMYISMLLAFMLAFVAFVQSARYLIQADFFISTPNSDVPVEYVQSSMIRANNFWQVGLRLIYFAMVFMFWSFGAIPMFASCVVMVLFLYFLDSNSVPLHKYKLDKKVVEDVGYRPPWEAEHRGKLVVEDVGCREPWEAEHRGKLVVEDLAATVRTI